MDRLMGHWRVADKERMNERMNFFYNHSLKLFPSLIDMVI